MCSLLHYSCGILIFFAILLFSCPLSSARTSRVDAKKLFKINCSALHFGQFKCPPVKYDHDTQQPLGCGQNNLAPIRCALRHGLICDNVDHDSPPSPPPADEMESELGNVTESDVQYVELAIACEYTSGYSFETALLFSIFLGMFGIDRFYLGYPAIGLLKFCTLGFLFLGQFIDIILIAMQVVRPADGSNYIVKHFGARINIINHLHADLADIPKARLVTDSLFDVYYYPALNST